MNLSKIIKDSEGFVPEKIVPGDHSGPPVWESLTQSFTDRNIKDKLLKQQHSPVGKASSEDTEKAGDEHSFDEDFSSPLGVHESEEAAATLSPAQYEERENALLAKLEAVAEENYTKGVQEGIAQVKSDYGFAIKTLQAACEELNSIRDTILKNSMPELQDLVLKIAEKIIRQSLATQQQSILLTVKEALQQAIRSDEFVIYVNPDDLDIVSRHSAEFIAAVNGLESILVKPDPNIDQGGCFIESENCTVDATIVSQLKIIAEAITKK